MAKLNEHYALIRDNIKDILLRVTNKESGMKYLDKYNITVHTYKFRKNKKNPASILITKFYIKGPDYNTDWHEDLEEALKAYVYKKDFKDKKAA